VEAGPRNSQGVVNGDPFISDTVTEFDAAGRVKRSIDSHGVPTEYEYDAAGRRSVVRDALGHESKYGYDANGNLMAFTNALGVVTEYEYDKANRRIFTWSDSIGHRILYNVGYDILGRRIDETTASNLSIC